MRRIILPLLLVLMLAGCATQQPEQIPITEPEAAAYTQIDQETAMRMMEQDDGHVVVDVRRQDEYDEGHIPGAILIPNESIGCDSPETLPDYDQIILIYCRSGNRSKQAAQKLAEMGYTNIYEFGGIIDWTGEIVTENVREAESASDTDGQITRDESTGEKTMQLKIGDTTVPVIWEENASVEALRELLPLTVQMSMYGGFEQVGSLGHSLPREDKQTTTDAGDIVLYSGDQIVIFYGSNSWSYTMLGHVDMSQPEMAELLSQVDVTITITEE